MDSVDGKFVDMATSLEGSKKNFASIIYGECSTISANFVKIGQLGVEIIGLKEITTIFLNTSETYSPPSASSKPGGLKKVDVFWNTVYITILVTFVV